MEGLPSFYDPNHKLMISENLLQEYEAVQLIFEAGDIIIQENHQALFFYQIIVGEVKMYNLTEDGKEFTQGIFYKGQSFAEPPLFGEFLYPAAAVAVKKTELFRLDKEKFYLLLKENFEAHKFMTQSLAKRLHYKATILKEISVHNPEHRISTLFDFLKKRDGIVEEYPIDLTRQQIADLTGLRVETVIRAVKQLETKGELKIRNRKIYR